MGLFFRKGINIGPARLNLSGSGVGASFGIPGIRIEHIRGRVESRFYPTLPHQTVHAVFPHTAFRCSSL